MSKSKRRAIDRFVVSDRPSWHRTEIPVGMCRSWTQFLTLLIFWPPGPVPLMNSSSRSCSSSVTRGPVGLPAKHRQGRVAAKLGDGIAGPAARKSTRTSCLLQKPPRCIIASAEVRSERAFCVLRCVAHQSFATASHYGCDGLHVRGAHAAPAFRGGRITYRRRHNGCPLQLRVGRARALHRRAQQQKAS